MSKELLSLEAEILFAKKHEGAIIPSKRDDDCGYDIYACFEEDYIEIQPGEIKMIPTGIASALPSHYGFIVKERGSTGSKGLSVRCGVIDSSYRGEWFIALNNTANKTIVIAKYPSDFDGEKLIVYPYAKAIAQAILVLVPDVKVKEISKEELSQLSSERGEGKLGSSGK